MVTLGVASLPSNTAEQPSLIDHFRDERSILRVILDYTVIIPEIEAAEMGESGGWTLCTCLCQKHPSLLQQFLGGVQYGFQSMQPIFFVMNGIVHTAWRPCVEGSVYMCVCVHVGLCGCSG